MKKIVKLDQIICGDAIEEMKKMEANSIDTIITDPPYALGFMGKAWDKFPSDVGPKKPFANQSREQKLGGSKFQKWTERWAKEALRVAKPGATLLCFGGTRTYHRLACAIEDAGWILKDCIMWLYGSGFPKAFDIGKKVKEFEGWKSHGLKPAYELISVAMKPNEGTYAQNALKYGVAGLNIDGGRIGIEGKDDRHASKRTKAFAKKEDAISGGEGSSDFNPNPQGRFPANIILDEEAAKILDEQSGESKTTPNLNYKWNKTKCEANTFKGRGTYTPRKDEGGASRFFYVAKASKGERNMGCERMEEKEHQKYGTIRTNRGKGYKKSSINRNNHPTVKPLKLMEYLCLLTKTPTGGIVLDPFAGSGTTGIACKKTSRDFIGIEKEKEYCKIAKARIKAQPKPLF